MHDYTFTGAYPRVLVGLSQGINATVMQSTSDLPVRGATIEAHPGDWIRTDEPYEHAELEDAPANLSHGAIPVGGIIPGAAGNDTIPVPLEPAPVVPEPPAPVADPAAEAMTAEGAPAPTKPAAS